MFGSKKEKQARMQQTFDLVAAHGEMKIEAVAKALGVDRTTVDQDLTDMQAAGLLLYQGKGGVLGVPDNIKQKRRSGKK